MKLRACGESRGGHHADREGLDKATWHGIRHTEQSIILQISERVYFRHEDSANAANADSHRCLAQFQFTYDLSTSYCYCKLPRCFPLRFKKTVVSTAPTSAIFCFVFCRPTSQYPSYSTWTFEPHEFWKNILESASCAAFLQSLCRIRSYSSL